MKRMIRIVALLMAALMMITSCQAPDSGSQLTSETVDVSFAGPSARTITTDDGLVQTVATSDLWFEYKAEWIGSGEVPNTAKNEWTRLSERGLTETVKLHRGTWKLSLRAFVNENDLGDDGKFILSGTLPSVEIGANNLVTQTVSINLGYVRQEGNGTLHISATYPVVYHEVANPESSPVEAVRKVKVTANVSGQDYTGEITAFDSNNVGILDLTVPAGAAHVTVQYYMDDSSLFEDDKASKDVLIMATMTTNLAVSVDRDITAVTFTAEQPSGTVEDHLIKATSLFDIYPGPIADNEIVIGYAEEAKALGDQTPITYPYISNLTVSKDNKGRYRASDLGLVPITVMTGTDLKTSGATAAWFGKAAVGGATSEEEANTTLVSVRFVDGTTSVESKAFAFCTALNDIIIPNGVTTIGDGAFGFCSSLTNITIPEGITSIGEATFWSCTKLTSITIPDTVTSIGKYAFWSCESLAGVTIPDSVMEIKHGAFENCTGLTSITIPDTVTSIGEFAFSGCEGLANVMIPNSVTVIETAAFNGCIGLTSITIPEGVTSIGYCAFSGCINLANVIIPSSITEIDEVAFNACDNLTDIYVNQPKNDTLFASVNIPSSCTVHWVVTLNSMFDVFPDTATTSDCIVGYRLTTDEAVSFPCVLSSAASPNEKGQYNATDLGLEPVIVTPMEMLQNGQANGWDKAWVGPDAIISEEDAATLNIENGDGMALKEIRFTGVSYAQGVWGAFAPGKVVNFSCGNLVNLEKVVLPDDIEFLLPGQFTNCMRLKDINFPASLQGAPFYVFLNCISLADININSNITTGDNGAGLPYDGSLIDIGFADTNPIYQEIIQDVLNTRGEDPYTWQYNYSFGPGVTQLWRVVSRFSTSFVIPEGIEELHHTFEGCERLTIDGITFPSTLKVIEEHTFGGCLGFTGTFEIPETVEKLGSNVFTGCDNLEKVIIPTSVTELTENPFGVDRSDNYPGAVEYKGTMEQWNQITGASNVTTHAITCSDGVIPKP